MATCKNCIHYDVCGGYTPSDLDHDVFNYFREGRGDEVPDIDERCGGFKGKVEWISVDERLPTYEDGKVLIYTAYGISIAQKTTTNHWKGDNAIPKLITHWMPLPEPPKGD